MNSASKRCCSRPLDHPLGMPLNLARVFFTYSIRIIGTSLRSLVGDEYNTLDIIRLILRTHGCFGPGPPLRDASSERPRVSFRARSRFLAPISRRLATRRGTKRQTESIEVIYKGPNRFVPLRLASDRRETRANRTRRSFPRSSAESEIVPLFGQIDEERVGSRETTLDPP